MSEALTAEESIVDDLRVLIVDDHDLFRSGLRNLLEEQGVLIVGEAAAGQEALRIVRDVAPDVVVMDLNMPGMGGVEATRHISAISRKEDQSGRSPGSAKARIVASSSRKTPNPSSSCSSSFDARRVAARRSLAITCRSSADTESRPTSPDDVPSSTGGACRSGPHAARQAKVIVAANHEHCFVDAVIRVAFCNERARPIEPSPPRQLTGRATNL